MIGGLYRKKKCDNAREEKAITEAYLSSSTNNTKLSKMPKA